MTSSSRWKRNLLFTAVAVMACLAGLYLSVTAFPQIGARGAESLRKVFGDKAVAKLEMFLFQWKDSFDRFLFTLGMKRVASPWQTNETRPAAVDRTSTPAPPPSPSPTLPQTPAPLPTNLPTLTPTLSPTITTSPTATPWSPPEARPLGTLDGEAAWQAYLEDGQGRTVAYRTFFQPDPQRPYALVAGVAFDLTRVQLNFILGIEEPFVPGSPPRPGTIPASDNQPGVLLAAFNGAFKSQHGKYGAMSDGVMPLEPLKGYATVAIYRNGAVRIGEWGYDFESADDMLAFRQNCRLIIDDGKVNPLVYVNDPMDWGANLYGSTTTWRSGLGISKDGHTLYYFAGPSLKMPVLAQVMAAAGVENGMQLDINDYWVHFVTIRVEKGKMVPEPLLPEGMKGDVGRYLVPHARDFFYIALK